MVSVETILSDQDDLGNFEQLCRLCGRLQQPSTNIFDEKNHYNYSKVLNLHFKEEFQVSNTDILPLKVCGNCLASVMSWHEFYHGCVQINKKFHDLIEKFNLKEEKKPDKVTAPANDIEVIEVSVDGANFDLLNEQETTSEFDISNVNIKETHSVDTVSDNDFDNFNDFGSNDESESSSDSHEKEAEGAEEAENIVSDKSTTDSQILVELDKKIEVNFVNIKIEENIETIDSSHDEIVKVEECSVESDSEIAKGESAPEADSETKKVSEGPKKKKPRRAFRMCHLCGKHYNTESGFRHHLVMHADPSFSCHLCGSVFYEAQNLKKHLAALHSDDRPFQCHLCGSKYKRKDVLQEHIKRVHEGIKRVWKAETLKKYRAKKQSQQKKSLYQCPFCDKVLGSKAYLEDHISGVHTKEEKYKCNECEMTFTRKTSFKYHFKRAHILKKNVLEPRGTFLKDCEYCGLQFQIKKYYEQHVASKHFHRYKCAHCEEVFDNKYQLTKHIDTVHADLIVRCLFCGKGFGEELHLKRHIYVCHTDRKPYECHECGYKANKKATLEVHIRRHTGERPYQCDKCPRRFTQSVDYRKHRANHMKKA